MGQPLQQVHEQWELPEIDPDLRERLKAEIQRWGRVLVPIVVDEHDHIIDGTIRKQIAEELGMKDIPRVIVPGLSDDEKHDLRVVLNVCRRHLTREQIRQWIAWELVANPHHSDRKVAGRIGVSPTTVGKVHATVQVGQSNARLGADGTYRRPAVVYTSHDRQSRQAQDMLRSLHQTPQDANLNLLKLRRLRREQERAENLKAARPVTIKDFNVFNCDFRQVGNRIADGSVDLAVVDPPWAEWESLGRPLGRELCRILRPNGLACVYTGSLYDDQWNDALRSAGLVKEWQVIGLRNAHNGILVHKTIRHLYISILLYRNLPRGELVTATMLSDLLDCCEPEKDWDEWQQPVGESVQLLKFLSKPGDLIADLCVGSGTVAVATALVGEGRRFVGCDIDEAIVAAALTRVAQVLKKSD